MTLFILSSRDGWVQIMYNGIDAVDVDIQPIKNYDQAKAIYFIAFILLMSFFVLNLFVGVVIENFQTCQTNLELLNRNNEKLNEEKKKKREKTRRQTDLYYSLFPKWRRSLYNFSIHKYFELAVSAVVMLNVMTMSIEHYQMSSVKSS